MSVRLTPAFERGKALDTVFDVPVVVLTEGQDESVLVAKLLGLVDGDVLVNDMKGKDDWTGKLGVVVDPTFRQSVKRLGLIRDAEGDSGRTFQSCCSALAQNGLPQPPGPGVVSEISGMKVGVFVLPDNASPGMIEDLMLAGGEALRVVAAQEHLAALVDKGLELPRISQKGLLQSYLAGTRSSPKTLTTALEQGVFDLTKPEFAGLRLFLHELAV